VKTSSTYDIAVIGAGVAGLACAVGAAQLGLRVALIGPRMPAQRTDASAPFDARIYAIAPATVALLDRLKVWPAIDAARVQPVSRMRVFGDAGNELRFDAYQAALPQLASIVEESELSRVLAAAAGFASGLDRIEAAFDTLRVGESARLRLSDGRAIEARLVIAADGARSPARAAAGINAQPTGRRRWSPISAASGRITGWHSNGSIRSRASLRCCRCPAITCRWCGRRRKRLPRRWSRPMPTSPRGWPRARRIMSALCARPVRRSRLRCGG
jgi:2-polyprenyl-6-methoxyphenol hydroxylase-like FAD-dependent oxidoreductase